MLTPHLKRSTQSRERYRMSQSPPSKPKKDMQLLERTEEGPVRVVLVFPLPCYTGRGR